MPRMPRDVSHKDLHAVLKKYGYTISRQTGSHVRLKSEFMGHEHFITIPAHNPIKIGTLNNILKSMAAYLKMDKEDLVQSLFHKK
ncbi:MAG TPA: type II toxin-antitoxin system HicA family toxin [Methanosarcinaceae archaeon]|nr:type II toxin-antitoxin system HicA family toxin [Methanosarcinaceae archaeon]